MRNLDLDIENETTCLFCVKIRPGIIFLLVLGILGQCVIVAMQIYGILALESLLSFFNTQESSAISSIIAAARAQVIMVTVVYCSSIALSIWGLVSAIRRKATQFMIYTIIYACLVIVALVFIIWVRELPYIIVSVINIYWTYVYYTYYVILNKMTSSKSQVQPQQAQQTGKIQDA